jgi:L-lactate dehydrogenase complex protein LldF
MMNMGNRRLKNWMVNKAFKAWTAHRDELDFAPATFNERWKTERKG